MIKNFRILYTTVLLAALLGGCTLPEDDTASSITIVEPSEGQHFQAGDQVRVNSIIAAPDGASSVELLVNGQSVRIDQLNQVLRIGSMLQPWQAMEPGIYTIQTRAASGSGGPVSSGIINIVVDAAAVDSTLIPATVQGTITVTLTFTETPTTTPTETPTPPPAAPTATATQDVNCRFGPATVYGVVSYLLSGQSSRIVGRNLETTWWVIDRVDGGGTCWLSADLVIETGDLSSVPVVISPPTPTFTPPAVEPIPAPAIIQPSGSLTCRSSVFLTWSPVNHPNGINHYEWRVTSPVETKSGSTTGTSVEFIVACGRSYSWQVRAVDGKGLPGAYSPLTAFTIQ